MMKFVAAMVALLCVIAGAQAADFAVGQRWSIKGSAITIVIGRIEPFGDGKTAVSISAFDVPCPPDSGCVTTVLAHAPFDSEALSGSVDTLLASDVATAPQFEAGYAQWKTANGGVFTIPVNKLPELLSATMKPGTQLAPQ